MSTILATWAASIMGVADRLSADWPMALGRIVSRLNIFRARHDNLQRLTAVVDVLRAQGLKFRGAGFGRRNMIPTNAIMGALLGFYYCDVVYPTGEVDGQTFHTEWKDRALYASPAWTDGQTLLWMCLMEWTNYVRKLAQGE